MITIMELTNESVCDNQYDFIKNLAHNLTYLVFNRFIKGIIFANV